MLSLVIILLSRFNVSRVTRDEYEFYPNITFYGPITSTWDVSTSSSDDISIIDPCYYLDYSGSLTLIVDNVEYKNPLFFCPRDASSIEFRPASKEVYYTEAFDLSDAVYSVPDVSSPTYIYIATKAASFSSPVGESGDDFYYDMVLAPIPGGSINLEYTDGSLFRMCRLAICFLSIDTMDAVAVTVKADSVSYNFRNKVSKRYSIMLSKEGAYVFTDESGLPVGAIVGISVSAVVVSGSAVGASVFIFLCRRRRKRDSDSDSESES